MTASQSWRQRKFGECVTLLSGGTPSTRMPAYWGGSIPWVSCKDMKAERLHDSQDHVTEEGAHNGTRSVPAGTILIVVRGMILAKAFPVGVVQQRSTFNQDLKAVVPCDELDASFLFHWLLANSYEIIGIADEAAHGTKRIQTDRLLELPLELPPVPIQKKIAAVLSAYDDLIENNERRIKILEEIAQNLYREWFVNFRFPGHEKVTMADSPLGKIPEGWELLTLADVSVNFDRLRKPLSSMQRANRKGTYPYYGAAKIFDYIDDYIFDGDYLLVAEDGSVITKERRPMLQLASGKFWANNHTHILQGKLPVSTQILYLRLNDLDVSGYVTGAAQPKITQANLNRIPFLRPSAELLGAFNTPACSTFREMEVLGRKNANLRQTRDLLLPKLIAGKLDVSELDIEVPEETA